MLESSRHQHMTMNQPNIQVSLHLSLKFLAWWYAASKSSNLQNGGRQFQICRFIFLLFSDVHVLLSRFYLNFILSLSRFYPNLIQILFWFYQDHLKTHFIQFFLKKSGSNLDKVDKHFIHILSGFYPNLIQILSR